MAEPLATEPMHFLLECVAEDCSAEMVLEVPPYNAPFIRIGLRTATIYCPAHVHHEPGGPVPTGGK